MAQKALQVFGGLRQWSRTARHWSSPGHTQLTVSSCEGLGGKLSLAASRVHVYALTHVDAYPSVNNINYAIQLYVTEMRSLLSRLLVEFENTS